MVNMQLTNAKLVDRGTRMLQESLGLSYEEAQQRHLMKYFDMPTLKMRISSAIQQLGALQGADGGWSWCKGMDSSPYITTSVMEILSRLASLAQTDNATRQLFDRGMAYLDKQTAKKVKEISSAFSVLMSSHSIFSSPIASAVR